MPVDIYKSLCGQTMQVFLSWSGERSHQVAQAFHQWLPTVLFGIDRWMSSKDIEKGANWIESIRDALEASGGVGLFFLTRHALSSQWFLFEAGCVAMLGQGRVCLIDVESLPDGTLRPPLANYQATKLERNDVLALLRTLNLKSSKPMAEPVLETVFERSWPDLEKSLQLAIEGTKAADGAPAQRSVDQRLDDIAAATQRIEARIAHLEGLPQPESVTQKLARHGFEYDAATASVRPKVFVKALTGNPRLDETGAPSGEALAQLEMRAEQLIRDPNAALNPAYLRSVVRDLEETRPTGVGQAERFAELVAKLNAILR